MTKTKQKWFLFWYFAFLTWVASVYGVGEFGATAWLPNLSWWLWKSVMLWLLFSLSEMTLMSVISASQLSSGACNTVWRHCATVNTATTSRQLRSHCWSRCSLSLGSHTGWDGVAGEEVSDKWQWCGVTQCDRHQTTAASSPELSLQPAPAWARPKHWERRQYSPHPLLQTLCFLSSFILTRSTQ